MYVHTCIVRIYIQAESILTHKRSKELDAQIMGVKPIITLIDDNSS